MFKVLKEGVSGYEMEKVLKAGGDLIVLSSPSDYFEGGAARNAMRLMKKYPKRKILVTDPLSAVLLEDVCRKAESGASLFDTYAYAERLCGGSHATAHSDVEKDAECADLPVVCHG